MLYHHPLLRIRQSKSSLLQNTLSLPMIPASRFLGIFLGRILGSFQRLLAIILEKVFIGFGALTLLTDERQQLKCSRLRFGSLEEPCYFHAFMETHFNTDHEF